MIHFQIIIVLIISLACIVSIVKQARIMIVPAGSVRNLAHWILFECPMIIIYYMISRAMIVLSCYGI